MGKQRTTQQRVHDDDDMGWGEMQRLDGHDMWVVEHGVELCKGRGMHMYYCFTCHSVYVTTASIVSSHSALSLHTP